MDKIYRVVVYGYIIMGTVLLGKDNGLRIHIIWDDGPWIEMGTVFSEEV